MNRYSTLAHTHNLTYFTYRALAKNCDASISEKGAQAKDWRNGKPVRVVRNCKERKISKYAPEEGNRYDGIYKVSTLIRVVVIQDMMPGCGILA